MELIAVSIATVGAGVLLYVYTIRPSYEERQARKWDKRANRWEKQALDDTASGWPAFTKEGLRAAKAARRHAQEWRKR